MRQRILIIDDDIPFCLMLKTFLDKNGFDAQTAFSGKDALHVLKQQTFDAVITDIRLPDSDGLDLLEPIKQAAPEVPVILITGYTDIKTAVNAIRAGAFDYVGKPLNPDELLHTLQQALKKDKTTSTNPIRKTRQLDEPNSLPLSYVSGVGAESRKLHDMAQVVAPTNLSVLIQGDSGTGKEYLAKAIHNQSKRAEFPFIAVDCGAIPKELASSEFFGHLKGSFTGAISDKSGHFEAANGGTLFLDEVGNLSLDVQIQLLRALQERRVKPVGSNHEIPVDIRLIAATNEDLIDAVKRGEFREDLYHRLNEFSLEMPRLSQRGPDIMVFAHHFLESANEELGKNILGFEPEVQSIFLNYDWPGNLREMKNTIRRSVLLAQTDYIGIQDLPNHMSEEPVEENLDLSFRKNEEVAIRRALEQANNNKSKAAKLLEIDRKTLYNKLKQYNIEG